MTILRQEDESMTHLCLNKLKIRNLACIENVDVDIRPFHAFIGPNDSGKSTLLFAMDALFAFAKGESRPQNPWARHWEDGLEVKASVSLGGVGHTYGFSCDSQFDNGLYKEHFDGGFRAEEAGGVREWNRKDRYKSFEWGGYPIHGLKKEAQWKQVLDFFRGSVWLLRLDPEQLRKPSGLIRQGSEDDFVLSRGQGLPGFFDLIFNRGDGSLEEMQKRIRHHFPHVERLRLVNASNSAKALQIELRDGTFVNPRKMSEGLLYFLAFLAIEFMEPPSMLLVEEPENGLHPARVRDVVRVLEKISKKTQVIMATHSPLVINEMKQENVSLVTRKEGEGTQVILLSETKNFEERHKFYALGELWLNHADGEEESALQPEKKEKAGNESGDDAKGGEVKGSKKK